MPAPHAWVHIEQLESTCFLIAFELDLHQTSDVQYAQQFLRSIRNLRIVNCFDVRAGTTKIHRVLTDSLRANVCKWLSILAHSGVRELGLTCPRDKFLHHDQVPG